AEDFGSSRDREQPAGTVYNIWYNKWAGGDRVRPNHNSALERSETRCNIAKDSGYTRATKTSFFCVHFARGCCARGQDCSYWHRIPLEIDRIPMTQDVFGRDRFRDDRDDMGGVGSFEKDNKTLYIGQLGLSGNVDGIYKHFIEWGEIEYIRLLTGKGVAFVRYKTRMNAEFAKEAMNAQAMDDGEVMNVRWATEDPNPRAAAVAKRKAEEQVMDAMKASLPVVGDRGTVMDYQDYFPGLQQASDEAAAQGSASKRRAMDGAAMKEGNGSGATGSAGSETTAAVDAPPVGWDTPNGFFYASNEVAAAAAAGAQDQAGPQRPLLFSTGWDADAAAEVAPGHDAQPPTATQRVGGAEYVLGVGRSRWYTGAGQPHEAAATRLREATQQSTDAAVASAAHVKKAVADAAQATAAAAAAADAAAAAAARPAAGIAAGRGVVSEATFHYLAQMASATATTATATTAKRAPKEVQATVGQLVGDYGSSDSE
ncbi:Pre-mRNA-splicing factor, partial [Cladochytrium tenue]